MSIATSNGAASCGDSKRYHREMNKADAKRRCPWCLGSEIYRRYHDEEWGVPVHDDRRLFEFLILEGAQAGLSWSTILNKRENYRRAFSRFDPVKVARFGARDARRLLGNAGIVRNRLKIESAIGNARAFLEVKREFGTFDAYLWRFVGGRPLQGRRRSMKDVPARTAVSDAISGDLKRRGFRFVGSTIVYAFMQAVGMVNDHVSGCFRRAQLAVLPRGASSATLRRR
jgi:DNA-3-methyladenine glycosylase I